MRTLPTLTSLAMTTLLLASCTTLSPEEVSTTTPPNTNPATINAPTPEPSPTPSRQDLSIQEAKDTFTTYIHDRDKADEAGYTPETITPVINHLTPNGSSRLSLVPSFNRSAEQGIVLKGKTIIGSVYAIDYTPGAPNELHPDFGAQITLTACTDNSKKTLYVKGVQTPTTGLDPACTALHMVNQGSWLIDSSEVLAEEYH